MSKQLTLEGHGIFWRIGIHIANLGKKHTKEWKQMMSEKNSGENNPNYNNHVLKGISKTEEHNRKNSEAKIKYYKEHPDAQKSSNNNNWRGGCGLEYRRNYLDIPLNMYFDSSDKHHLNERFVLFVPSEIHESFSGYRAEKHREMVVDWLKQQTPEDFLNLMTGEKEVER